MKVFMYVPMFVPKFMRNARWDAVSISNNKWYPIWMAYSAGLLEKCGNEVLFIDAEADEVPFEKVLEKAEGFKPDFSVVYITTKSIEDDVIIAERLKDELKCRVFFVGPWCSIDPRGFLRKSKKVDGLITGEFDFALKEIAEGKKLKDVKGLYHWVDGKIEYNGPRTPLTGKELDELPFVTSVYERHLHVENYRVPSQLHPFVDLFTGRGCAWGKCTFCLWPHTITQGGTYRIRSIKNVIEEIRFVQKELPQVKEIFIQDDTFPEERAVEFSKALIENGIDIIWSCYARATLKRETLLLMKEAGCRCLHVGYESANEKILKLIVKGTTKEGMERFTKDAADVGLRIHADFIIGLPGETKETIRETIDWAKKLDVYSYQFTIPKPFPGTPLYEWAKRNDYVKDGEMSYPGLSNDEIREAAKNAMKECYFNPRYVVKTLTTPDLLRSVFESAAYVIPNMFWKRWS